MPFPTGILIDGHQISDVTLVDIKDLPDPFDCIMIVNRTDRFVM